jgi:membrane protease YdiL (CAAX protease family)
MSDPVAGSAPTPPSPLVPGAATRLFIGRDGLRAFWSVLLFAIVLIAAAFLVAIVGVGAAMELGANPRLFLVSSAMSPGSVAAGSYPFVIAVLIATIVMARAERRSPWSYGLAPGHALGLIAAGAGWGFLALSALIGLLALSGHITVGGPTEPPVAALRSAAEWALAFLGVGLFEETLARGYLQGRLSRAIGFWPAAVLLSILFGAGHYSNGGETATGLIGAGTVGLVFCYSLWRSGSLWWAIGFHTAWDWAQSYFYGTHDSGLGAESALLTSHPTGAAWLSGGSVGPEGSVLVFVILIAVALVVRWTLTPPPSASTAGAVAPLVSP